MPFSRHTGPLFLLFTAEKTFHFQEVMPKPTQGERPTARATGGNKCRRAAYKVAGRAVDRLHDADDLRIGDSPFKLDLIIAAERIILLSYLYHAVKDKTAVRSLIEQNIVAFGATFKPHDAGRITSRNDGRAHARAARMQRKDAAAFNDRAEKRLHIPKRTGFSHFFYLPLINLISHRVE